MIPKNFEDIEFEDVLRLKTEKRSEDKTIEYKKELPHTAAESEVIPKLLKPVCSFSNTDGGDLIYGMLAKQGIPQDLEGVTIDNVDEKKLTLDHLLQTGIEPQVRGIQIKEILLPSKNYALIIRVPKSWISPHRVKNNSRFYARNSAGTYELDIPQIRQAFLLSDTVSQRMREFRAERIGAALGNEPPAQLKQGAKILLHLAPLSSFTSSKKLPVDEYKKLCDRLLTSEDNIQNSHLNFDGVVATSGPENTGIRAYTQLFRSGIIEYARTYDLKHDGHKCIPSGKYEHNLIENCKGGLALLKDLGFDPPVYIFLTLIGIRGYQLTISQEEQAYNFTSDAIPFKEDILAVPHTLTESFKTDVMTIMKPILDMVWNASGHPHSMNYK